MSVPRCLAWSWCLLAAQPGCSVQKSELLRREASAVSLGGAASTSTAGTAGEGGELAPIPGPEVVTEPLAPELIAVIDERPIGGASLAGGTVGGGDYATAFAAGQIVLVDTPEELVTAVSGDEPRIVLVAAGSYIFSGTEERATCLKACEPATPVAQQTIISGYCTADESVSLTQIPYFSLEVGSNKTVIGLEGGAHLTHVELDLSKGSNKIVRNLSIADVSPGVAQFGYGVRIWPGHHVWIDHLTVTNIGHSNLILASDYDGDTQVVTLESGFITVTRCHFDGFTALLCDQRTPSAVSTHRARALTFAENWFERGLRYAPYLFGPGTWGHLFNNLWTDHTDGGLRVGCGSHGLAQGNVFSSTSRAIQNSDNGAGTWSFCATGYFGSLYAPLDTDDEEENLLLDGSTVDFADQPSDGSTLLAPSRTSGTGFRVEVPIGEDSSESYDFELAPDPDSLTSALPTLVGVGRLFDAEP